MNGLKWVVIIASFHSDGALGPCITALVRVTFIRRLFCRWLASRLLKIPLKYG